MTPGQKEYETAGWTDWASQSLSVKYIWEAQAALRLNMPPLRDQFAMAAIMGMDAFEWQHEGTMAHKAYAMADAMLAERAKKEQKP